MIFLNCRTEDVADIYEDFCKNLSIYDQYMTVYYESQLNSIDLEEVPWLKDVCDRIQVSHFYECIARPRPR